jgi:hypothetical protein
MAQNYGLNRCRARDSAIATETIKGACPLLSALDHFGGNLDFNFCIWKRWPVGHSRTLSFMVRQPDSSPFIRIGGDQTTEYTLNSAAKLSNYVRPPQVSFQDGGIYAF